MRYTYGMLSHTRSRAYQIIEIDSRSEDLRTSHLEDLANSRCAAIRLKNFCPPATCQAMTESFMAHTGQSTHPDAQSYGGTIGLSLAAAIRCPEYRARYIEEEESVRATIRRASGNATNPLDKLMAELCGAWRFGVMRAEFPGIGPMHPATVRMLNPGNDIMGHTVDLGLSQYESWQEYFATLQNVLSVNVYLQTRSPGGELYLYMKRLPEDVAAELKGDRAGIPLELLGEPEIVLAPEQGEVIIFESTKLHGVVAAKSDARVTLSAFLGVPKAEEPIRIWV